MSLQHMWAWGLWRSEWVIGSPGSGVIDGREPPWDAENGTRAPVTAVISATDPPLHPVLGNEGRQEVSVDKDVEELEPSSWNCRT